MFDEFCHGNGLAESLGEKQSQRAASELLLLPVYRGAPGALMVYVRLAAVNSESDGGVVKFL